MDNLPPYIKGVIEGGKPLESFSADEKRELQTQLAELSDEDRDFILTSLEPDEPLTFMDRDNDIN